MKKLTIKSKILILIGVGMVVLSIILATISVGQSKDALMNEYYNSLTSARDSKAKQIENFFHERIADVKVLARANNTRNLLLDIEDVYEDAKFDLNGPLPINHKLVQRVAKSNEEYFQNYMKDYGYYDIFIVNAKHGHVLYSAAKESDYGANLKHGVLKDSGLAQAYQKAIELKRPVFIDMKPYAPSAGAPSMFLATPVYIFGELEGVLIFQVSDASINKIMQFRSGYGKSQEDYLIGEDKLMRSDSFLDPKGHSLKASFANPSTGNVDTQASINALAGKKDTQIVIDYNGNPVLSAYQSINIGKDFKWAILSEIDEAETLETPMDLRNSIIMLTIVLLLIIGLTTMWIVNNMIVKRLLKFQEGLVGFFKYVNREASDVQELETDSFDEIGNMSKVVNENIIKAKAGIEEDRKVIDESIAVLSEFEHGDLAQRVSGNTSNPALQELTGLLNQMGVNLEDKIDDILSVLEKYSSYNYMDKVETKGIKEHLLRLANGINSLGDAITGMLSDNKSNGLTLQGSSTNLLGNVTDIK